MSEDTSQQAPEPFDPRSAEEVAARFNEAIAAEWLAATTHRRKAMIKQLLSLEEHERKRQAEEAANRVIPVDEDDLDESAEDALRAARRAKAYLLPTDERYAAVLRSNRDRYLAEVTMKRALLQGENVQGESRLREDVSTRCLQIHAIDLLLQGRLSFDALKALVESDERCAGLSPIGIEYEYDALLERLIIKRFVIAEPSAPSS